MKKYRLKLTKKQWTETVLGLYVRGMGKRETACIWAGHKYAGEFTVREIMFLDDIPGVIGRGLRHKMPTSAIDRLFITLKDKGLTILADLHTHPDDWVGLSWIDKEHPLEYRLGFLMIVLPYYASTDVQLEDIGVHEYMGAEKWRELPLSEIKRRIIITEDE